MMEKLTMFSSIQTLRHEQISLIFFLVSVYLVVIYYNLTTVPIKCCMNSYCTIAMIIQGTSDYQSSISSSQWTEGYAMSNYSSSTKPAEDNFLQAVLPKTSCAAGVAGKPTMEEISARLSAKLALLEASQQVSL